MYINKKKNKYGITFVEVMIALFIMGVFLLPVFGYLTSTVKDVDKVYCEAYAISRAKFIMDSIMFQIPYRVIFEGLSEGAPCRFKLVKDGEDAPREGSFKAEQNKTIKKLLQSLMPKMFGCENDDSKEEWDGDGTFKNNKDYIYRVRVNVKNVNLKYGAKEGFPYVKDNKVVNEPMPLSDITSDGDLIKKITLHIIWGNKKGEEPDPTKDKNLHSLFLVGYKANLD